MLSDCTFPTLMFCCSGVRAGNAESGSDSSEVVSPVPFLRWALLSRLFTPFTLTPGALTSQSNDDGMDTLDLRPGPAGVLLPLWSARLGVSPPLFPTCLPSLMSENS